VPRCHEYGGRSTHPDRPHQGCAGMRLQDVGTDPTVGAQDLLPHPPTPVALVIPPRSYTRRGLATPERLRPASRPGTPFAGNSFARIVSGRGWTASSRKAYAAAGIDAAQPGGQSKISTDANASPGANTLLDTKAPYGPYAARPLYGNLGRGALPAQRIGPDVVRPAASPGAAAPRRLRSGKARVRPGEARLRRRTPPATSRTASSIPRGRAMENGGHLWGTDLSESDRMAPSGIPQRPTDAGKKSASDGRPATLSVSGKPLLARDESTRPRCEINTTAMGGHKRTQNGNAWLGRGLTYSGTPPSLPPILPAGALIPSCSAGAAMQYTRRSC